ncbi:hypothetical protein O181_067329 [Austropuccinia psidii MF-1]|uniref:Integrase catalytic domain-containing protein n=1 Tax=Austropuccinia psidii MF-1 TaxID=1389203 RepID=A0A9Q3EV63_9BASI|nr:hypothetical protein [Austropuccinia psidii MF-1]
MTDRNLDKEESYIPLLDGANYTEWHLRMRFLLRSQDLLDVCENSVGQDASTTAINRWKNTRRFLLDLQSASIQLPPEILSYIILGKLGNDPSLSQVIEMLTLNDSLIEKPDQVLLRLQEYANLQCAKSIEKPSSSVSALVASSEHQYKITHYCSNGLHNPKCTTHRKEDCYAENPHLRPSKQSNKRKIRGSPAAAHLVTARALITSTVSQSNSSNQIVIDCGPTHHMFYSKDVFCSFSNVAKFSIATGDSSSKYLAEGIGSVVVMVGPRRLTLTNCLYVPKLNCNLVSLMQLFRDKLTIIKSSNTFSLRTDDVVLFEGEIINNLMKINFSQPTSLLTTTVDDLWHKRLGQPGKVPVRSMGLPSDYSSCKTCDLNKIHQLPFKSRFEHVSLPLDCVHLDLVGPISPPSAGGSRYFLTIIDQFTSYKITCMLKNKSDTFDQFVLVKNLMENHQQRTIKKVISDRGGEFTNKKFEDLSASCGFTHIFSPPYTPQHNGFAEHANRTILDKAKCLLNESGLAKQYWAEAINTSTLLTNLIPTPSRQNLSPYALWTGKSPRIKKLRVFGCQAITFIPKNLRDWKLAQSGRKGVFLGYENDIIDGEGELVDEAQSPSSEAQEAVDEVRISDALVEAPSTEEAVDEASSSSVTEEPAPPAPPRLRVIGPRHPTLVSCDIDQSNILPFPRRPETFFSSACTTPRTFKEAISSPDHEVWLNTMSKELKSMADLNVWEVVDIDPSYKLVGTTWVFKIKKDHLGKVIEHKARLCAQGFTQTFGVDFEKTYSPTGRLNSLRVLIAFATTNRLLFHQIDVKSVFLNAPLSETVFLSIPQGVNLDRRKSCLRLKKAIYGLKQAPLSWYQCLKEWLVKVGFFSCTLDPCVFFRSSPSALWLYVHVDDIAIFGKEVETFKAEISSEFDIKDLGKADLMLGIKVTQAKDCVTLDQQHFAKALLDLYGMSNCRPVSTPLIPNQNLSSATDEELSAFLSLGVNFRSAVGSVNYLSTATRPDLFDADWGNCTDTRWSVTGYLVQFNNCLVIWKTRKQPTVSLSTSEAEYKSLCDVTAELLWLRQWCSESQLTNSVSPTLVHEDNQGCINAASGNSNINGRRMKHFDIQLHFVREAVKNLDIELQYTPTSEMLADFLTKSLTIVFVVYSRYHLVLVTIIVVSHLSSTLSSKTFT